MIDPTTLITYVAIVLGFVFLPGPATLLTVARAASSGTKVGIATGSGIATGDVVHTFMAIVGISAIIAASAMLFSLVKYAGAVYLIYLGIRAILAKVPADFRISSSADCRSRLARRTAKASWRRSSIRRPRSSSSLSCRSSCGPRTDWSRCS
jgi:threonine/homoserine/homoserine lactone efflux protein